MFTDFLYEDGPELALRRMLSRGMELHAFHIFSPAELSPNLSGDLMLIDQETGESLAVTVTDEALERYKASVEQWADGVLETCRRLGVGYTRVVTSMPIEELVLHDLRRQRLLL